MAIANNFKKAFFQSNTAAEPKWKKPKPKSIKINVDAAYFGDEGVGATTVVVRVREVIF